MKKDEEQFYILEENENENEKDKKEKKKTFLIPLFILSFIVLTFTASFSYFSFEYANNKDIPVTEVEGSGLKKFFSWYKDMWKFTFKKPATTSEKPSTSSEQTSSSSSSSSSSSQVSSSSSSSSNDIISDIISEIPTPPPTGDDEEETAILKVVYVDGTEIHSVGEIIPGWRSNTKKIKVTNAGTVALNYNLVFTDVVNQFSRKTDLVYHASIDGVEVASGTLPSNREVIIHNVAIAKKKTQVIDITIEYLNKPEDQSIDMGKMFYGTLLIENAN